MKRLYLSGKMSGLPNHGFDKFAECANRLRNAGYTVLSPAEMDGGKPMEWHEYLRRDLRWLVDCDGIALISNWRDSQGAKLELSVALALGMPVIDAETLEPLGIDLNVEFKEHVDFKELCRLEVEAAMIDEFAIKEINQLSGDKGFDGDCG